MAISILNHLFDINFYYWLYHRKIKNNKNQSHMSINHKSMNNSSLRKHLRKSPTSLFWWIQSHFWITVEKEIICGFDSPDFMIYSSLLSFYFPACIVIPMYVVIYWKLRARARRKSTANSSKSKLTNIYSSTDIRYVSLTLILKSIDYWMTRYLRLNFLWFLGSGLSITWYNMTWV